MAKIGGVNVGNSDIRRVSQGQRIGGSHRQGWGISTVSMSTTITPQEAKRRIRMLRENIRDMGNGILLGAAHLLKDQWKYEIDAEGYGPSASGGELGLRTEVQESIEAASRSTGRYYDSIEAEVDQDLQIHVGSTIPRPSGRGLEQASYPELLEYGTSKFEGMFILKHALDAVRPDMEAATFGVYSAILKQTLMEGRRPSGVPRG